ncbi:MAG TPA: NADP oxidoreductase [Clostridia bacterium]|nr:NADP oxidoreductase [Clostridia bacterium]
MSKVKVATVWLDGCSGCHMSLLDIDERLIALAEKIDLLYGPLVDAKVFPEWVDVTLVEGAVSSEEDLAKIRKIRAHTKILISLGDCAVTGNVPSMRDVFTVDEVLNRTYVENSDLKQLAPESVVPKLLNKVRPVHEFVNVDIFVPGCPPSADNIFYVLSELLEGRMPDLAMTARFGA